MAGVVFTSAIKDLLKPGLGAVWQDPSLAGPMEYKGWCKSDPLSDAFEDDLPIAGPGFAQTVPEGGEVPTGDAGQHVGHRYLAEKRGLRMVITEEAVEDGRYGKAPEYAKMIRKSLAQTKDMISCLMLQRGFNTAYGQVDGVNVWSASQTLRGGGTFSNVFATAMAPSVAAIIVADTMAREMVGLNGIKQGVKLQGVICPTGQRRIWEAIFGSTMDPEAGNFSKINVANKNMSWPKGVQDLLFWDNTTTNYAFITDAEHGFKYRERRAMKYRTYMVNENEMMVHHASERYVFGMSDPRGTIGVNA